MLKRLQSSESRYKSEKFENEFKKNQEYVKNLCLLPVKDPTIRKYTSTNFLKKHTTKSESNFSLPRINLKNKLESNNFNKNYLENTNYNQNQFNNTTSNFKLNKKSSSSTSKLVGMSASNFGSNTNNKTMKDFYKINRLENEIIEKPAQEKILDKTIYNISNSNFNKTIKNTYTDKVVYSRKAYLEKLGLVEVIFILNENNFFITIKPSGLDGFIYTIIFSQDYEINKLTHMYASYEDIIHDIIYDGISINFKSRVKAKLNYVS